MPRRTILKLAALTIAVLGAVGCGGSEPAAKTEPNATGAVVELRAPLFARDADTVLLRFGGPKGWKGNQDANKRLPVAAIEKPKGGGCRLFVQIVAGPRGVRGVLQPGEAKLLRKGGTARRSVKVIAPRPPRVGTFSFGVYGAPGGLALTGPGAISIGELRITRSPAIPPLVIIARGGFDGCSTKAPSDAVAETRAALRVLIEQMSVEVRRRG